MQLSLSQFGGSRQAGGESRDVNTVISTGTNTMCQGQHTTQEEMEEEG